MNHKLKRPQYTDLGDFAQTRIAQTVMSRVQHSEIAWVGIPDYNCRELDVVRKTRGILSPGYRTENMPENIPENILSNNRIAYWISEDALVGPIRLAVSDVGVCKLALGRESDEAFFAWLARKTGPSDLIYERIPLLDQALSEVNAYLSGTLREFETPSDLRGTAFQRRVWAEVAAIPYGVTSTYREVAARVGRPMAFRAVGAANAANPVPLFVPCHRVVGADGALRGYGGGMAIKAALLKLEGAG